MLIRSVFVRFQSSRIPAFVCGPREARGQRLASLGVGGGGTSLRSDIAPRFARTDDLASLGQAELRKWLSSVGACVFLCSANPWKGAAVEGSRASTYQVTYQRVDHHHLLKSRARPTHAMARWLARRFGGTSDTVQKVHLVQLCLCQIDILVKQNGQIQILTENVSK